MVVADLGPLVLAARLSKEGWPRTFVQSYLAYHWRMDWQGKALPARKEEEE